VTNKALERGGEQEGVKRPEPVMVLELFSEERAALLELLEGLTPAEWEQRTVCAGWSVKDVALHILGGDLGNISRRRDSFSAPASVRTNDLVAFVNGFNEEWVRAARRLSPRVVIDLLRFAGPQLFGYFGSLDLDVEGAGVSWAGLERAPVWLDVAREYTERWMHQQHIRDAVGRPGLTDRRLMGPVLATFVYSLPRAFGGVSAPAGTAVHLHIAGEAGGDWTLVREEDGWTLYAGAAEEPYAVVSLDQSAAWRLFTKGIGRAEAEAATTFSGDRALGLGVLDAVAIIA
jgi:uncharacterized protein (TIGR03083 family)